MNGPLDSPLAAIRRLRDTEGPDRFRTELLEAGLLSERGPAPEGDTRAAWDARGDVLRGLGELFQREARITQLSHRTGVFVGTVPQAVWWLVGGLLVLLTWLFDLLIAIAVSALALGAVALVGLVFVARAEQKRVRALAEERAAYRACASRILAAAERALGG